MVVGDRGFIATSSDGISWTKRPSNTSYTLKSVVYGKEKFVVIGSGGTTAISNDGFIWNTKNAGVGEDTQLTDLIFTN